MSGVLVVADRSDAVTAELVGAGAPLGGPLAVLVVASEPDVRSLAGVDEVLAVRTAAEPTSEELRQTLAAVLAERAPDVVLAGFTADAMAYGPAVAAAHGLGFASDVVAYAMQDGALVVHREIYDARVRAELSVPAPAVLLLRPGAFAPAPPGAAAPVSRLAPAFAPPRVRHRSLSAAPAGDADLATADVILAIGRGVGDRDNVERYAALADRLGLTLAASGPLVRVGWMPQHRLVGRSGRTVAPKLYLAVGISGAAQHLAGIARGSTIVAVNTDPQAPIFGAADYGAIADAGAVADALEKLA